MVLIQWTKSFVNSSVKSKDEDASSTEEDWDADEKEETTEEKKEIKSKSPKVGTCNGGIHLIKRHLTKYVNIILWFL